MTETIPPDQAHMRSFSPVSRNAVALFCTITVLLTVTIILLPLPMLVAPMLVVFIPTLSAIFLITLTDGWAEVGPRLFRKTAWRTGIKWVLVSLAAALVLRGGTSLFALGMGYPFRPQGFTPFLFVTFLLAAGEEIGWRGYALPLTLKRFSPLTASLLLGIPWALLHTPLTLPGKMLDGVPVVPVLLVMLSLSVLTSWLYLSSGKSILAPVLLHGGQNVLVFLTNGVPLEPVNWAMAAVYGAAALLVILLTRGRLQPGSSNE